MATTPLDPRVKTRMLPFLDEYSNFGNASSAHDFGRVASDAIDTARNQVAAAIHAQPTEIIWTSGATEANNLALQGAAHFYQRQGKHIITMATEHKAVLDVCVYLQSQGFEITYLPAQENGLLDLTLLQKALRPDTIMVSIMWVNNETGVIQPIEKIASIVKKQGALLHVDAAQAIGKLEIDTRKIPIDLISMSAHKVYGPKGVGALYVRREPRVRLQPILYGGGHEQGIRSGTLATHQLVGMGEAFSLAQSLLKDDLQHAASFRTFLSEKLQSMPGVVINSDVAHTVPHCLNFSVLGIPSETLVLAFRELALATGSACNSATHKPSHVLQAMQLSPQRCNSAIRISVGRMTTSQDVENAGLILQREIGRLRYVSGLG